MHATCLNMVRYGHPGTLAEVLRILHSVYYQQGSDTIEFDAFWLFGNVSQELPKTPLFEVLSYQCLTWAKESLRELTCDASEDLTNTQALKEPQNAPQLSAPEKVGASR
jgi:hypothetical protein